MGKLRFFLISGIIPFSLLATEVIEVDSEGVIIEEGQKAVVKSVSESDPQVVIMNNQRVDQETQQKADHNAQQISNQPIVRVIGTPTSTNYAVELKKSRHEAEIQTEQKIVEKLESSRLRDEQERLRKLFGAKPAKKLVVSTNKHETVAIVEDDGKRIDQSEVYTEIVSPKEDKSEEDVYIGLHVGQSSNLTKSLDNINSYGSFGLSFGASDDSGLVLESAFMYSKHEMYDISSVYYNNDESNLTDVHQMAGFLSLKYTPFSGRFKPYIGVAISYNYWIYSDKVESNNACSGFNFNQYCDNQVKADSVDLGANVGVDLRLNHRISIGFNILANILNLYNNRPNQVSSDNYYYSGGYYDPIKLEETNWIIASINAKLYF